jgi:hypothetical protein
VVSVATFTNGLKILTSSFLVACGWTDERNNSATALSAERAYVIPVSSMASIADNFFRSKDSDSLRNLYLFYGFCDNRLIDFAVQKGQFYTRSLTAFHIVFHSKCPLILVVFWPVLVRPGKE